MAKSKWRVLKHEGAWQAFDTDGNLRYAADDWWMVYSFARLGLGPIKPRGKSLFGGLFE